VIVTWHGGSALQPFEPTVVYTSLPHMTTGAVAMGPVHLAVHANGATAKLQVRTGADPVTIEAASFVDVEDGQVPAVTPSGYVQYRVELDGDGWQFPSVESVELDYLAPVGT
jgi:hypothetical protein